MKSIISLVAAALSISSAVAFVPSQTPMRASAPLNMAKLTMTPELESAIADVRAAAAEFSEETAHFANGEYDLQNVPFELPFKIHHNISTIE